MRRLILCLAIGALAAAALRHLGGWPQRGQSAAATPSHLWSAMSFALAAVVDTGRGA